jgi:hypothetical protein
MLLFSSQCFCLDVLSSDKAFSYLFKPWLRAFMAFISTSKKILGLHYKANHDCLCPHHFQVINNSVQLFVYVIQCEILTALLNKLQIKTFILLYICTQFSFVWFLHYVCDIFYGCSFHIFNSDTLKGIYSSMHNTRPYHCVLISLLQARPWFLNLAHFK